MALQGLLRRSVRIAPGYTQGLSFLALGHYWHGSYDSAAVWADSAVRVDPQYILGWQTRALVELERGHQAVAEDQAQAAFRLADGVEKVNAIANLALIKARGGNINLARTDLLTAEVAGGGLTTIAGHTAVYLAEAQLAAGYLEKAIKTLGTYNTPRDMRFQMHLRCSPTFAPLEQDSAFRALLVIPRPARGTHC